MLFIWCLLDKKEKKKKKPLKFIGSITNEYANNCDEHKNLVSWLMFFKMCFRFRSKKNAMPNLEATKGKNYFMNIHVVAKYSAFKYSHYFIPCQLFLLNTYKLLM